jgi:hypothetical protein
LYVAGKVTRGLINLDPRNFGGKIEKFLNEIRAYFFLLQNFIKSKVDLTTSPNESLDQRLLYTKAQATQLVYDNSNIFDWLSLATSRPPKLVLQIIRARAYSAYWSVHNVCKTRHTYPGMAWTDMDILLGLATPCPQHAAS